MTDGREYDVEAESVTSVLDNEWMRETIGRIESVRCPERMGKRRGINVDGDAVMVVRKVKQRIANGKNNNRPNQLHELPTAIRALVRDRICMTYEDGESEGR